MAREMTVLIAGAGVSGKLLAINLLRQPNIRVILIERDNSGRDSAAYYPDHLLHAQPADLSAYDDKPDHFLNWLAEGEKQARQPFLQPRIYRRYLDEELAKNARIAGNGHGLIFVGEAIAAHRRGASGFTITLSDGTVLACDILIHTQDSLPPAPNSLFSGLPSHIYCPDPAGHDWQSGLADTDHLLLLGTGIRAVNALLALDRHGFRGRVTALSRTGLRPQVQQEKEHEQEQGGTPKTPLFAVAEASASSLPTFILRQLHRRAKAEGWHRAIDALRPHMHSLWNRLDSKGKSRFLRHISPYWAAHHHPITPYADERLRHWREEGRLDFAAGQITHILPHRDRALVEWRIRGQDGKRRMDATRIINCASPQGEACIRAAPLLRCLEADGIIRTDAHHQGLDTDTIGRAKDKEGAPRTDLYITGPLARGDAWTITTVADIRRQAAAIAHAFGS